ncbi:MAG: hypothetical protein M0Z70_12180 [Nitrospiraceae bacterium]|nr:hypothetical protein [Nitrospiraceae bacterium]
MKIEKTEIGIIFRVSCLCQCQLPTLNTATDTVSPTLTPFVMEGQ